MKLRFLFFYEKNVLYSLHFWPTGLAEIDSLAIVYMARSTKFTKKERIRLQALQLFSITPSLITPWDYGKQPAQY